MTGAPFIARGAVPTPTGVAFFVGDIGGGVLQLARDSETGWKLEKLITPQTLAPGRIAVQGDVIAVTGVSVVMGPISTGVVALGVSPHSLIEGCNLGDNHAIDFDSKGAVVAGVCGDELYVFERRGTAWSKRASWPSPKTRFEGAIIDAADRVHISLITAGVQHYIIVDGTKRTEAPLPNAKLWVLRACKGRVYATLERDGVNLLGHFRDGTWSVDAIGHGSGVPYVGFDQDCRAFIGADHTIWSRGAKAWVSSVVPTSGTIKALIGKGGKLHVAYEEVHNGVEVWIATAPLIAE